MSTLIDTTIWSDYFRRTMPQPEIKEQVDSIIMANDAVVVGPVRQELLSGLRDPQQFEHLKVLFRRFEDEPIGRDDFERAAEYYNRCRRTGLQGSATDFAICAVAERLNASIFTLDKDFERYAEVLPIKLYKY